MKKYNLILLLTFINIIAAFSQNYKFPKDRWIDYPKDIAISAGIFSGQKQLPVFDGKKVAVMPCWNLHHRNFSDGNLQVSIKPEELTRWIDWYVYKSSQSIQIEDKYRLFYRFRNSNTYVIWKEKEIEEYYNNCNNNNSLAKDTLKDYYDNLEIQMLLTENCKFKNKIIVDKNIKKAFDINFTHAYLLQEVNDTLPLNGYYNLLMYNNESKEPIALYYGELFNGLPHGYGMLIKDINENGFFQSLIGFWEMGQLENFDEIKNLINNAAARISFMDLFGFELPPDANSMIRSTKIKLYKDILNPNLSNAYELEFYIFWYNNRYVRFTLRSNDFFNEPEIKFTGADGTTMAAHDSKNSNENSLYSLFSKAFSSYASKVLNDPFNVKGDTYEYNDYRLITKRKTKEKKFCNSYIDYQNQYGLSVGENDVNRTSQETKFNYANDIYIDYSIKVRSSRGDSWQELGTFTTKYIGICYDEFKDGPYILSFWDNPTQKSKSDDDALNTILKKIEEKYPYPINDPVKSKEEIEGLNKDIEISNKIDAIKWRISKSPLFSFSQTDSLKGAWSDQKNKRIYFCLRSSDKNWSYIDIEDLSTIDKPYTDFIKNCSTPLQNSEIDNQYATDVFIKLKIKKLANDRIEFTNGLIWKRI